MSRCHSCKGCAIMLLKQNKEIDAFDFLSYLYGRLLHKFYSNGIESEVSGKEINQYLSILFRFDKKTTQQVLAMLEQKGFVSIQRGRGNGSFIVILRCENETKNEILS